MSSLVRALALSSLLIAAPALAEKSQPPVDGTEQPKLKCKKFLETGSLAKKRRVCLTARQWAEVKSNAQDRGREMQTLTSTERGN